MYLMHNKFVNSSFITNCKFKFSPNCAVELSDWNPLKMPNVKSKNILEGLSDVSTVKVHVVGSGAVGVPSNAVLISGNTRYLINCGEGTQKLGSEYRFGLEKVSHVFITSPLWKNISGLLGLSLSSQKLITNEFVIHGHNFIGNVFSGINKFVNLRYNYPQLKRCHHYEEFSDGNISVKYVYLYSSSSRKAVSPDKRENSKIENEIEPNAALQSSSDSVIKSSNSSSELEKDEENNKNERGLSSSEKFKKSPREDGTFVISYIFQTPKTSGALLFEKCIELGVPPGPLLGELKRGKDVTLDNGKLVRSADVKNPDLPGINVIAVECPSEDYLDSLLKEPIYRNYQSGENVAGAVIHFSSSKVVKNPKYQAWISCFAKETKHLFLNEDNKLSGSVSIRRQQFKLNYLHPDIFPLLQDGEIPDFPRADNCIEEGHTLLPKCNTVSVEPIYSDPLHYKCESNSFINAETLCTLNLKPKSNYDFIKCLVLKKREFLNEMFTNYAEEIEKCKGKLKELELTLEADKRIYPKIVFLGTGSGKPSKMRNPSGILLFLEDDKCILFDCGENIYNQLINFYGKKKVTEILRKLVAVYISHLHIDHHMGLITILKERKLAIDNYNEALLSEPSAQTQKQIIQMKFQPVYLLAPMQIRVWLSLYSEKFEDIRKLFNLLPNAFLEEGNKNLMDVKENCKKKLNLSSLITVPVNHCQGSFGISIVHENGWKITYSGDTRPCDALVRIGMESDILIHEATFEDAYSYGAKIKSHSTTSEAINIGRKMNAKYILLTHFSQRYCYLPVIEDNFKNINIGFAFDFMEVPFNKLPLLPALLEPLQYIFSDFDSKIKAGHGFLKRKENERNFSEENSFESSEKSAKILKQS